MQFIMQVFPAPLGPMIEKISPFLHLETDIGQSGHPVER